MATNTQEGPSDTPQSVIATDKLSEWMVPILKENPLMPVRGLPGAQEWTNKFFQKGHIPLDPQESFLMQVVDIILNDAESGGDIKYDVTPWEPYDDGYDEGPGDLMDSWNTDDYSSNGQFSGTVVDCENVFDHLGAVILCVASVGSRASEDMETEFSKMMKHDWVGPVSQKERDLRVMGDIRLQWGRLSPEARVSLLAEFGGTPH